MSSRVVKVVGVALVIGGCSGVDAHGLGAGGSGGGAEAGVGASGGTGPSTSGSPSSSGNGASGTASSGSAGSGGAATVGVPPCDPPNTVEVSGKCVPSCGVAGGNTCVAADSTLCEGLPALGSYDCPVCCARPTYAAPPGPAGFHIVSKAYPYHWDSILGEAQAHASVFICSQEKPDSVDHDRWCKMLHTSSAPDGAGLAKQINQLLVDPVNAPRIVMVDELNGGTIAVVDALANEMHAHYPQWEGRWGAFTTVFTGGQPAIDSLLVANAYIAVERYIEQDWYCQQGANGGERDIALATFFDGNASLARYSWLVARKGAKSSTSPLSVVFGVTDRYMSGTDPAIYLDRMFYVWATRTNHPEAISIANGGAGAWKWDPNHPPGGFGTSSTSRDQAFAESLDWYSVQGKTTSRLGPVPCP